MTDLYDLQVVQSFLDSRNYIGCREYLNICFNKQEIGWMYLLNEHYNEHRQLLSKIPEMLFHIEEMELGARITDLNFLQGWESNIPMYNFRRKISRLKKLKVPESVSDNKEWYPCNPSICPRYDGQGYYILQRLVNFSSNRATNYVSHSSDGLFKTRNLLITTDKNFKVISTVEVMDESGRTIYEKHVRGLEDMQIFQINEKKRKGKRLGVFCTLVDCQANGIPKMGFGIISISTGKVNKMTTLELEVPNPGLCEKNWLPYYDYGLRILYSGTNMKRYRFKVEDPSLKLDAISGHDNRLRDVRGSGGPIEFDEGFLILFHEVIWINNGRTYIHRFVHTDKKFNVLSISTFFTFENSDIEFARSMIWDLDHDNLLLGVGVHDHESYIYIIDPNTVRDMLNK